jgi:type IV secretion system protein VirD4
MAGYKLKSFLIAQSLNQIEKAYGANNSILDNCHVRVSFATNDERTAKRVSDALGIATEMRAMKNYAGHRLSPWLGHLMISRQETARPLMTAGEVMQLPPDDEIVMVAGVPPIRAKKARYFEDPRLAERILPPPNSAEPRSQPKPDDWSMLTPIRPIALAKKGDPVTEQFDPSATGTSPDRKADGDSANAGLRREPGLERHKDIAPEPEKPPVNEFEPDRDESDDNAVRVGALARNMRQVARQAAMDPRDGIEL